MKTKSCLALLLALALTLSLFAGCASPGTTATTKASGTTAPTGPATVIKVATAYPDGHYMVDGYNAFKAYVEKESNGRLKVEIFANGSIVNGDRDSCEYVSSNSIQMGNSDFTMIGTFISDKRWESTSIPYYYGTNPNNTYKVIENSTAWASLIKEGATKGKLRVIGCVNGGSATMSNDERSVASMADFKGIRIRVPESAPYMKPIELWGANATPMSFSEIYTSVQQGVIDGVFTSKSAIVQYKITEVCKYHTDLDAFLLIFGFMVNEDFFSKLDKDLQDIILAGGKEASKAARAGEEKFRANLNTEMQKQGVTVTVPSDAFFADLKAAVAPYVETRRAEIKDFIEQLDKDMKQILG